MVYLCLANLVHAYSVAVYFVAVILWLPVDFEMCDRVAPAYANPGLCDGGLVSFVGRVG